MRGKKLVKCKHCPSGEGIFPRRSKKSPNVSSRIEHLRKDHGFLNANLKNYREHFEYFE